MHRPLARLSVLALAALALVCVLAPMAHAAGSKIQPRIVHGNDAAVTDFPFQALLYVRGTDPASPMGDPQDGGGRFCGGVVRDATHIITAAHCVYDVFNPDQVSNPGDVSVLVGSDDLDPQDGTAVNKTASALSFDPDYDPDTNVHDVAIVTLPSDLYTGTPAQNGTDPIAPIDLVTSLQWDAISPGDQLTVSGWGDSSPQPPVGSAPSNFKNHLQAADVPLVADGMCSSEYDDAGVPVDTSLLFCAGDHDPGGGITDSCQGDSGGPIVREEGAMPPPHDYVLVGLVDSGIGCAQAGFPGIYTRLVNSSLQTFLMSNPLPAPTPASVVTIAGVTQAGQALTCHSDPWTNGTSLTYQFFTTNGTALTSASADGFTYTIQQKDLGSSILCEVEASNNGGYGFAHSSSVFVPAPAVTPPPVTPPPAKDTTAPKLRVRSKKCTQTSCTVKVKVSDSGFSAGISKVRARLNYTRRVSCRKHGKKTTCKRRAHRALHASRGTGGIFTIVAKHLKAGTGYSISLLPFDKAGNKPSFSTITNVRTQRRHRRGFLF